MLQVYLFWFLLSYTMQQEAGVSGSAPLIHTHHGHMPAISILSDSCERGVCRKNANRAAGVGPNISINTPSKRLLKKPPKPGASWPYFMQGVDKRWLLVVWWEAIHNSRRQMKRCLRTHRLTCESMRFWRENDESCGGDSISALSVHKAIFPTSSSSLLCSQYYTYMSLNATGPPTVYIFCF